MNTLMPGSPEYRDRPAVSQDILTSPISLGEVANPTIMQGSGIRICTSAQGLSAINAPGNELVICRRSIPFCVTEWLKKMAPSQLPALRILVSRANVREALESELDAFGMASGRTRDAFIADIADLVSVFAGITRQDLVNVRLDRIEHDACWKFHKDSVEIRLLTTYRGETTEWISPQFADRALREQKDYDGPLESLRQHDVAIFRGKHANSADGIVHRSPPIAGTGSVRLLLCLNAPSIVSPEQWRAERRA